jgi:hypothetical protein
MGFSQIPGSFAPAQLFLGKTFTAIPDSMRLQLQSCFFVCNFIRLPLRLSSLRLGW